jgi:hypothetical protein
MLTHAWLRMLSAAYHACLIASTKASELQQLWCGCGVLRRTAAWLSLTCVCTIVVALLLQLC